MIPIYLFWGDFPVVIYITQFKIIAGFNLHNVFWLLSIT